MNHVSFGGRAVRVLSLAFASWMCVSCGSEPDKSSAAPSAPAATSSSAATSTHTPASGEQPAAPGRGALVFTPPQGWFTERPTSTSRVAQYRLPRAEQDTEDASVVVTFFGGQGGSRDANVERWASQFEQLDGRNSRDAMETSERTVNGMRVFEAALSGTYVAETSPGSGQRYHKEGWRMLAGIVEAPLGPHYLKLTGPEATVRHWESSFRAFVSALKAQP